MAGKAKDLTGMKFGRLTVIERETSKKGVYWLCQCECGNITKPIRSDSLKSGTTTSCGCLHKEKVKEHVKDLTGQKFGRLTVIERATDKKYSRPHWICQCECGNTKIIQGGNLKSGDTISCGCYNREKIKRQWENNNFRQMKSDQFKQHKGNKNPNYKGGITPISEHLRKLNIQWYEDCKQQANYTCQLTGKRGCKLNTHHLKAFSTIVVEAHEINNIEIKQQVKDYTEQELQLLEQYVAEWHKDNSNAVVLCEEVHILFHNLYGRGDNTPQQYEEFKQRYLAGEFNNLDSNNNKVA